MRGSGWSSVAGGRADSLLAVFFWNPSLCSPSFFRLALDPLILSRPLRPRSSVHASAGGYGLGGLDSMVDVVVDAVETAVMGIAV